MRRLPWRLLSADRPMGRRRPLLIAFNLVAALVSAGVLLTVATRPLDSQPRPGSLVLGEVELQEQAARAGVPEGRPAPGFGTADGRSLGLTALDGRPLDLAELGGSPVWMIFWATYCHACQEEEPDLRRAYAAHRPDVLSVLAIDAGEKAGVVRSYVEERRLPWRIALDPDRHAFDTYGAIGTPTHYFINRHGRIVSRAFGRLELDEMEVHLAGILEPAP